MKLDEMPEGLTLKNQSPSKDYYVAFCVMNADKGEVRFFDVDNARIEAWKYRDKHGGVVMIAMAGKNDGDREPDFFPDRRPEE